jgi:hypothetical protein
MESEATTSSLLKPHVPRSFKTRYAAIASSTFLVTSVNILPPPTIGHITHRRQQLVKILRTSKQMNTPPLLGPDAGPVIPPEVDLSAISKQEAEVYVSQAADIFLRYFPERLEPTEDVSRANARVGPGVQGKVLLACNVTPDVRNRHFAETDYYFQARPRLEMDYGSSCLYVYNVPSDVHGFVKMKIITTLSNAMEGSGIQ